MVGQRDDLWPGQWVADSLGIALGLDPVPDPVDPTLVRDLMGLALRRNPRRAHLPVSRVLGKHVPCDPRLVRAAGLLLGLRVRCALGGPCAPSPGVSGWALGGHGSRDPGGVRDAIVRAGGDAVGGVVLGFAENATALGHLVADALDADHVVHSTRRVVRGAAVLGEFEEPHSHARHHLLVPDDPHRWTPELPLVLVDDELSTGRTAAATLRLLHRALPRPRYVMATLVDLRAPGDDTLERAAADLGVHLDVVALARGPLELPPDVLERGTRLVASCPDATVRSDSTNGRGAVRCAVDTVRLPLGDAPEGARHGLDRADRAALEAALPTAAACLTDALGSGAGRVLVLGCEEFLYLPVRLAEALADAGYDVDVSATSRSPVVAVDTPAYAVRTALAFAAHDAGLGARERYAYNLGHPGARRYDTIVLVVDEDARTRALRGPGGLVDRLRGVASRVVEAVAPCRRPRPRTRAPAHVPARRGPAFGTFEPDEVGWLLSDLSAVSLEVPLAQREDAIRRGRAHYSETLPEEPVPSVAYEDAFQRALTRSAPRVAAAVGLVTDRVLAARGPAPVLVSLARAGTPVGVLMRRWASRVRGVDLPHYTVSVVRGRGIDRVALAALTAAHDPAALVFVDGWTGKGAIVDEVATDLAAYARETGLALDPTVAALADPGHCTPMHGSRDDLLVPSACLNARVSGLISRTVLRPDLLPPDSYHGAKFYPELVEGDRTATVLDVVSACFPAPGGPEAGETGASPDRRGRRYVAALADQLGVHDEHRVKPGIGETTRVLLRRAPAAVLLAPDADADVDHIRLLCRERGVPVSDLPVHAGGVASPYRCVGLIGAG